MDELNPQSWHDFFAVYSTAAAALLGLVLVAISIHVQQVERDPLLRNRARVTLVVLTIALVNSLVGLIPHVMALWFGGVTVAVNVAYIGWLVWSLAAAKQEAGRLPTHVLGRYRSAARTMTAPNVLALVSITAGISLMLGRGPALFLLAPALILLLPAMLFSTWSLLFAPELSRSSPDDKRH